MEIKHYYGKVILFGEYSMIFGSPALIMPLYSNSAHWDYIWRSPGKKNYASNRSLRAFADYLCKNELFADKLNIDKLRSELRKGLFLDSNIPTGYGVGSSGALTAAIYDRFHKGEIIEDYLELKSFLGAMENCFHGNSSGLDPLQCFIGKPFIISDGIVDILDNNFIDNKIHIFLVDSGEKAETKRLVNYFMEQHENDTYRRAYNELYLPLVNLCIEKLVSGNIDDFFTSLERLSYYQTVMLRPMLTDNMLPLMKMKRSDAHFQIKICGSGGGGFYLGFSDDKNATETFMKDNGFPIVWIEGTH
ncbi:MAG: mevalonate kinase [Candidatus Limimorpha sp.]